MLMYYSVGVHSVLMIMDLCVLCLSVLFFPCTGGRVVTVRVASGSFFSAQRVSFVKFWM